MHFFYLCNSLRLAHAHLERSAGESAGRLTHKDQRSNDSLVAGGPFVANLRQGCGWRRTIAGRCVCACPRTSVYVCVCVFDHKHTGRRNDRAVPSAATTPPPHFSNLITQIGHIDTWQKINDCACLCSDRHAHGRICTVVAKVIKTSKRMEGTGYYIDMLRPSKRNADHAIHARQFRYAFNYPSS